MAYRRLLMLGGYGHTGRLIARLLLVETELDLVLAGRSKNRAQMLADELNLTYPGERVAARRADAADHTALPALFAEVDLSLSLRAPRPTRPTSPKLRWLSELTIWTCSTVPRSARH